MAVAAVLPPSSIAATVRMMVGHTGSVNGSRCWKVTKASVIAAWEAPGRGPWPP
jgi:hypothetical protein